MMMKKFLLLALASIVLGETVVAPVLFTGLALWEPVDYVEPKQTL